MSIGGGHAPPCHPSILLYTHLKFCLQSQVSINFDNIYQSCYNIYMECEICKFNRYIERCHIIPKRLGGRNDEDNMLYLCPNHHKLLDNMLLDKEEITLIEHKISRLLQEAYKRETEEQYIYLLRLLKLKTV